MIDRMVVRHIELPTPKIGGKSWLLCEAGVYVFERGPGTFRTKACTHAGSGGIRIFDGVPDAEGHFQPVEGASEYAQNGREFFRSQPVVMGSWMLDAGFYHGLTVRLDCGNHGVAPLATLVWMPAKKS